MRARFVRNRLCWHLFFQPTLSSIDVLALPHLHRLQVLCIIRRRRRTLEGVVHCAWYFFETDFHCHSFASSSPAFTSHQPPCLGAVSRPLDLREVWRLNSYRSLFIRVFRFPFCMSPYKLDQLPRTSLSKSRNIFLANAFRTKVVIEQHQQQLCGFRCNMFDEKRFANLFISLFLFLFFSSSRRLQVRPEIFVVRQLKHPNIIQLLYRSHTHHLLCLTLVVDVPRTLVCWDKSQTRPLLPRPSIALPSASSVIIC